MIADLYHQIKNDPTYNKVVGSDYLIVEYKCPIESEKFQLLTQWHFIMYIVSGRKDWVTSGKTYEIKENDAVFLRKGVYTTRQHFDTDHCVLLFFINDDFIRRFVRENNYSGTPGSFDSVTEQVFQLEVNDTLKTLFLSVFNYLKSVQKIPQNLIEIKFKELLFNIMMNPRHEKLSRFFTSLLHPVKSNFDEVMMKNFMYDLSMEEFARLCGKSLSTFKRDFKHIYNQTPGNWLKEMRLEFAHNLLLRSDLNINEICYECGFKNAAHFNKAFKDKYNLPPSKYRTKHNNSQDIPA